MVNRHNIVCTLQATQWVALSFFTAQTRAIQWIARVCIITYKNSNKKMILSPANVP